MATVLDLSVLKTFMPIFSWIFAFLLVYGFLEVTQIFKNKGIHAMLAFVFSIMVAVSGTATTAIASMAPWFLVIIFFVFIVYLIGNFMGLPSGEILSAFGGKGAIWWILILGFVILAVGLSQTFGEQLLDARQGGTNQTATETGDSGTPTNHGQTVLFILTDPKILGMILILLISALTVVLLTQR